MNPTQAREALERAAASVTPAENDPAARMVSLGRRSVRRRRAGGACAVAVAVAAVAVLPFVPAITDRTGADPAAGTTVTFGGLSVAVPEGWRTSRAEVFYPCAARPNTVYFAARWDPGFGLVPSSGPYTELPRTCESEGKDWMAFVQEGNGATVSPERVVVKDGQPIQVMQWDEQRFPSMRMYRAYTDEIRATEAFISSDETGRARLLERIGWPAGPPAPPSGGLALPDHITDVLTDAPPSNAMVMAMDAKTVNQIRAKLAALRDPVPAGQECTLQKPGSVGISLGEHTVVLGDATCPQAISTGGGRVRAPAGLGEELLDLIVASDRARSTKD